MSQEYAFRAQKTIGITGGLPKFNELSASQETIEGARTYQYSQDGRLYAYALQAGVRIFQAQDHTLVRELPLPNIIEIALSPLGTYLSTWERPVKVEEGQQHKNLRVWNVATGEEVVSFFQKSFDNWDIQYTSSEDRAVRLVGPEVQIFDPAQFHKGFPTCIMDKIRIENATLVSLSPGKNPHVAVFIAEKKGSPASVRVYGLSSKSPPTCSKNFYKADKCTMKWNALGTQVLALTSTEIDKTNKNYYGETNLYLLSASGNFECRVTLDKEGPIHDFSWSPNSKEFGVVYGFMPSKAVLFDQRVKVTHDFGSNPRNFILFNPQSRLVALAGFGNLAGKIEIVDRRSLEKVCVIDAPNTSWCEWSPDGRLLMTATLSPRLRVDNGIKIWHCTGELLHVQLMDDLYQASWRPAPVESQPPFGNTLPQAPVASAAAQALTSSKPVASKPAGAYRPPGARGSAASSVYQREDEAAPAPETNGHHGRHRNTSSIPGANGHGGRGGARGGPRHVPGAPPPAQRPNSSGGGEDKKKRKNNKKDKKPKEGANANGEAPANGEKEPPTPEPVERQASPAPKVPPSLSLGGLAPPSVATDAMLTPTPVTPGGEGLDPLAKRIRNLNKKLKAIEELKEKVKRGEKMEVTQLKKIEGEAEIRKELNSLIG